MNTTGTNAPEIQRSERFILYFQLDGCCNALRLTLQTGQTAGPKTVGLLNKLYADVLRIVAGNSVLKLPKIEEADATTDMLSMAEVLRSTMLAFLSPEEVAEKNKIGFVAQ